MSEKLILSEFNGIGILSSDVINKNGVKLAEKDTILNEYIVQHLMAHKIKYVSIYHSSNDSNIPNNKLQQSYIDSVVQMKELFQEVLSGKPLEYQVITQLTEQIQYWIRKFTDNKMYDRD